MLSYVNRKQTWLETINKSCNYDHETHLFWWGAGLQEGVKKHTVTQMQLFISTSSIIFPAVEKDSMCLWAPGASDSVTGENEANAANGSTQHFWISLSFVCLDYRPPWHLTLVGLQMQRVWDHVTVSRPERILQSANGTMKLAVSNVIWFFKMVCNHSVRVMQGKADHKFKRTLKVPKLVRIHYREILKMFKNGDWNQTKQRVSNQID